jgi:hypothetical protein
MTDIEILKKINKIIEVLSLHNLENNVAADLVYGAMVAIEDLEEIRDALENKLNKQGW